MSKLRSVSTSFWSDPFIEELTTNQKLLYLYFITNEKTNMLGIYEVSIKKISYDTGISAPDVIKALKVFEGLNKVNYIDNYIILNNFLKHQNFNTNMMKSAIDCYNELPKLLKHKGVIVDKSNPLESFRTLSNALLMVRKVETEVEVEEETEEETKKEIAFSNDIESCYNSLIEYFNTKPKDKKASDNWKECIKQLNEKHQVKFSDLIYIVSKVRSDEFWSKNFMSLLKLIKKNKEDIYYIDYFIEKFGVNPINTTTNQLQSKAKIPPTNQLMKVNYPSYE